MRMWLNTCRQEGEIVEHAWSSSAVRDVMHFVGAAMKPAQRPDDLRTQEEGKALRRPAALASVATKLLPLLRKVSIHDPCRGVKVGA